MNFEKKNIKRKKLNQPNKYDEKREKTLSPFQLYGIIKSVKQIIYLILFLSSNLSVI